MRWRLGALTTCVRCAMWCHWYARAREPLHGGQPCRGPVARARSLTQTGCDASVLEEEECPTIFLLTLVCQTNWSHADRRHRSKSDEGDTSKCEGQEEKSFRTQWRLVRGVVQGPTPSWALCWSEGCLLSGAPQNDGHNGAGMAAEGLSAVPLGDCRPRGVGREEQQ